MEKKNKNIECFGDMELLITYLIEKTRSCDISWEFKDTYTVYCSVDDSTNIMLTLTKFGDTPMVVLTLHNGIELIATSNMYPGGDIHQKLSDLYNFIQAKQYSKNVMASFGKAYDKFGESKLINLKNESFNLKVDQG